MENVLEKIVVGLDKLNPNTIITAKLLKAVIAEAIEKEEEEEVDVSRVFSLDEEF